MNENRSKQILDSTFFHLEKAIEEMRRKKMTEKKNKEKASGRKSTDSKQK